MVLRLLRRCFGSLEPDWQMQIQQLSIEQVEALGDALLDFPTSSDLASWLRNHQRS